jgi:hypothetical protein
MKQKQFTTLEEKFLALRREIECEVPPPALARAVLSEFRRGRRRRVAWMLLSGAAVAAALLIAIVLNRPADEQKPSDVALRGEVATEFMPLHGVPSPHALTRGRLVRVKLPRSAMTAFGLPVNQDRLLESIDADVVLGEDGMATAIRFVQQK